MTMVLVFYNICSFALWSLFGGKIRDIPPFWKNIKTENNTIFSNLSHQGRRIPVKFHCFFLITVIISIYYRLNDRR